MYGVNIKAGEDMSDVHVEVWSRKIGKKNITSAPELKSLPPTSEAFRENVKRAHNPSSHLEVLSPARSATF